MPILCQLKSSICSNKKLGSSTFHHMYLFSNTCMFLSNQDNEPRVSYSLQQPSLPWVDSPVNISVGGLLSEASLLGRLDSKSFGSNTAMQPSQIISDSLDAFIASQINNPPVLKLSAEGLRTSILDAEETCHAFPLQKLSSPADVQTASGKGYSVACSQDVSSNSFKLPCTDKVSCS